MLVFINNDFSRTTCFHLGVEILLCPGKGQFPEDGRDGRAVGRRGDVVRKPLTLQVRTELGESDLMLTVVVEYTDGGLAATGLWASQKVR